MDQTTDTADLTETEKYLNSVMDESGDESDGEEEAQDALLGGIRTSLRTITRTAREALSTCKNKTELDSATEDIEDSALKLMKMEKSFLKTATIVSSVIDDFILDFEDDDDPEVIFSRAGNNGQEENLTPNDKAVVSSADENGSGDANIEREKKNEPYVFQVSSTNISSVMNFREKLKKELHHRMEAYKDNLSNSCLKTEKKFRDLLAQVKLGRSDAETSPAYIDEMVYTFGDQKEYEGGENDETDQSGGTEAENYKNSDESLKAFLDSIPYTAEELMNHKYVPYDEEADTDDSVLPSVDPITKELILNPVKNKFCNHVFEKESILSYIACTPEPKCPVYMCKNKVILEDSHFVSDPALTACIRRKNQL